MIDKLTESIYYLWSDNYHLSLAKGETSIINYKLM